MELIIRYEYRIQSTRGAYMMKQKLPDSLEILASQGQAAAAHETILASCPWFSGFLPGKARIIRRPEATLCEECPGINGMIKLRAVVLAMLLISTVPAHLFLRLWIWINPLLGIIQQSKFLYREPGCVWFGLKKFYENYLVLWPLIRVLNNI